MANSKCVIPLDIYNQRVTVYISDNPSELFAGIIRDFELDESEKWQYSALTFCKHDGTDTSIIFTEDSDVGDVAHECLRAICSIFSHIGISMVPESEECYSYLLGHLTKKIMTMFARHSKKVQREKVKKREKLKLSRKKNLHGN